MSLAVLRESPRYDVAASIVRELQEHTYVAYFAGGCIRDALLNIPPKDIDIATSASPEQVQALFHRTIPVGIQFGVVRVRVAEMEFEVATFRSDGIYLDGRHPSAIRFSTPEQDAARRDFTINGMFYDPLSERLIDYVTGREDLAGKLVRAIGQPSRRFAEDRLRMLRALRFAAVLGFEIEAGTWSAIRADAQEIAIISPERIRDELLKMLVNPNRLRGFDLLDQSGLLAVILPEIEALKGCDQPEQFHPEGDVFVHTRLMLSLLAPEASGPQVLAVLLHDIGKPRVRSFDPVDRRIRFNGHDRVGAEMAEKVMTRLRFPRHEIDQVVDAVSNHMVFKDVRQMRPAKLRRFMARPHFGIELELHRIDCAGSHGDLENYHFLINKESEFAQEPLIPARLVRGDDLIAMGLKPGPRIGELLEAVQTAQLEGEIKTRREALELLRTMLED
ncbi:MAG TPA: CCA tRNA nucleotidyltransferase [Chthoniobacterales bacterium]|jgi:putative nucleotidyltransferase with HDIG domain|nr:CCA tRNA nucleotidyltransferase [Chthoniobacterales bacterium]